MRRDRLPEAGGSTPTSDLRRRRAGKGGAMDQDTTDRRDDSGSENAFRVARRWAMVEAERDLLAALLWDPSLVDSAWGLVTEESFVLPWHGRIFEAIRGAARMGLQEGADSLFALRRGIGEEIWAAAEISNLLGELCERVPTGTPIAELGIRVRRFASRRLIEGLCAEIAAEARFSTDEEDLALKIDEYSDAMCAQLVGRSYLYATRAENETDDFETGEAEGEPYRRRSDGEGFREG